jgi:hypothetical protein
MALRRFPPPFVGEKLFLLFAWELYDHSITIPQLGANTSEHFFGLLGRRSVIIGINHHSGGNQLVLIAIKVKPIVVHSSY